MLGLVVGKANKVLQGFDDKRERERERGTQNKSKIQRRERNTDKLNMPENEKAVKMEKEKNYMSPSPPSQVSHHSVS